MIISVLGVNGTPLKAHIPEPDSLLPMERCSNSVTAALNIHHMTAFETSSFFKESWQKQRGENEILLVVLILNLAMTRCIFLQGKEKNLSPAR